MPSYMYYSGELAGIKWAMKRRGCTPVTHPLKVVILGFVDVLKQVVRDWMVQGRRNPLRPVEKSIYLNPRTDPFDRSTDYKITLSFFRLGSLKMDFIFFTAIGKCPDSPVRVLVNTALVP